MAVTASLNPDLQSPGTVLLEGSSYGSGASSNIIRHPVPSEDPNDPLNWSRARKTINFSIISLYTIVVFSSLTVAGPLWQPLNTSLGITYNELNWAYATNSGALAMGCVIFIPLALKFGRRPVYIATSAILTLTSVWQAKQTNRGDMFGAQVLSGLAGATNETLIQLTIADLYFVHQRGTMNGLYLVMLTIGNFLAPVASGYIATSQSWRWAFGWCAILMGMTFFLILFFYEETKFSVSTISGSLPPRETIKPEENSSTKDIESSSVAHVVYSTTPDQSRVAGINPHISLKSYRQRLSILTNTPGNTSTFVRHVYQPFLVLCLFPAVAFTAIQYGFGASWIAVLATTQSTLFPAPPYLFRPSSVGLLNLPPFIGSILGSVWGGPLSDLSIVWLARRNKGVFEPEMRLYMMIVPALATPIGLFVYGFSVSKGQAWIIPCVGAAILGFGINGVADISLTYLMDSYKEIIGDALIGVAFVRNALATALVFALPPWMEGMGVHNMFVVAGCLSLAICLLYIPMIVFGKRARVACANKYVEMAKLQYESRMV